MAKSAALDLLKEEARSLGAELNAVNQAIAALEGMSGAPAPAPRRRGRKPGPKPKEAVPAKTRRRRPTMTAEQRNAVSLRMKRYWAARREAKEQAKE